MDTIRKTALGAAMLGTAALGGLVGASFVGTAGAATSGTDTTATTAAAAPAEGQAPPQGQPDPSKGGHQANGTTEELLTGDTAAKVTAAAKAAVPGATVERVETDAEGAAYEAHLTKADGSQVTVKLDASFKVTSTEDGHA